MSNLRNPTRRSEIKAQVVQWIRDQRLRPGDRILPQTELARQFATTEVTIHRALTELCSEGVLHRRKGVGTFVGPDPLAKSLRNCCLVLPSERLETAEANPRFWPHVQSMIRAFIGASVDDWTFTTRAVAPDANPLQFIGQFETSDAIFFHFASPNAALIQLLVARRVAPVLRFGLPDKSMPCVSLDHDRTAGVEMGVRYLLDHGHRRIGLITSVDDWARFGIQGYRSALAKRKITVDAARVARVEDLSTEDIGDAVEQLMAPKRRCDAIFCDGDHFAVQVIEVLEQRGLAVPQDVSVMGYDGVDQYREPPLRLASVRIPYGQMIADGLRMASQATTRHLEPAHFSYLPAIQEGATVAPADRSKQHHAEL